MINKQLKILEIINSDHEITQREISVQADISLGKTNNLINNLIDNEFINVNKSGKGAIYTLTDKGFDLLEKGLKMVSMKRINLNVIDFRKIEQAVIIATDKAEEFDKPSGFLEIDGTTIINRIINTLWENGIENIIIIAGYKNNYYDEFAINNNITLIKNTKHKFTGSMASLALAKDYVKDDFILIDSNIAFEERALTEVLNSKQRDCMLLTPETGSGSEVFVEIRNDSIYNMAKIVKSLNRIDGELVPITRISRNMYIKMLKEYDSNENPYLSYKHQLLNMSRKYRIGYIKIDGLSWYKISNKFHYKKVVDLIYPKIKRKRLIVEANIIKKHIAEALNIEENSVNNIIPIGGMTNYNYKFQIKDDTYVIRIPGNGTGDMIDRRQEIISTLLAMSINVSINVIYANETTGIMISELVQDAETLNFYTAKREKNMNLVAELLRRIHDSNISISNEFHIFKTMEHYEKLATKSEDKFYKNYDMVKECVFKLKEKLQQFNIKLTPCHNDPVPENFIKGNSNKMYLLDWEYAGLNDPLWDIAAYCLESNFDEDEEELFLDIYFCGNVEENYKERILIYKICQDFLWSIWTIVKEASGDDFGTYGMDRFIRAKDNLSKIFQLNRDDYCIKEPLYEQYS